MIRLILILFALSVAGPASAWGEAGHSTIAEIAQRRLTDPALREISKLLGQGKSLASISSWADDIRGSRPETSGWHFVNIPIEGNDYDEAVQCKPTSNGDCIVAELLRLQNELGCISTLQEKREALAMTVHFIADLHQPLHTVANERGGNKIDVVIYAKGPVCAEDCNFAPVATNLHAAWDKGIIDKVSRNWGNLTERIENGWLKNKNINEPNADSGTVADWVIDTHRVAQKVWSLTPTNKVIDDQYLNSAVPILDRQLGVGGLRLAKFLNDILGSTVCAK